MWRGERRSLRDGIYVIQGTREPSSIWHEQLRGHMRTENTHNGATTGKFR